MTKAMSTRIISATVAIILAVIVLILHKTFIFDIAVGCLAVGAVYELFKAMDYLKFRVQSWICMGYAFLTCVSYMWWQNGKQILFNDKFFAVAFVIALSVVYLKEHETYNYKDFFLMLAVALVVPYSFSSMLKMNTFENTGLFMIIATLCGAWLADSGAYFAGTFFGKTPLCPSISPKKTVEGVLGGVVCNGLILIIVGLFYDFVLKGTSINYLPLFLAGMVCAIIGLVGDLTASIIKRQTGIKDYGNLMPGHGGVMDRFDSVLFVAPFMYYVFTQGWIMNIYA